MNEEIQGSTEGTETEVTETKPEITPVENKPAVPSYEDRAKKFGHVDYETWCKQGKMPEEWIDAETYVKNFTWVREINKLKDTVDKQKKAMEFLVDHSNKVEEVTRKKTIDELNKKLEDAVVLGDTKTVTQLNDQLVEIKLAEQQAKQPAVQAQREPDHLAEFRARNSSWFQNNNDALTAAMTAYAFRKAAELDARSPNADPRVSLQMIEDDVKRSFPQYFTTTQETKNMDHKKPPVESSGAINTPKNNKITLKDLPKETQQLAEVLKKTTRNFNEDLFIKQYQEIESIRR